MGMLAKREIVALDKLVPFPGNPRRGNVRQIMESLTILGQFRTLLVQKGTNYIIAGNHTAEAMRELGWEKAEVDVLDVDDETATRINVADNRMSDLATWDNDALLKMIDGLPDLDATGFTDADVDALRGSFKEPGDPGVPADVIHCALGTLQWSVTKAEWAALQASLGDTPEEQIAEAKRRLADE